MKLDSKKGFIKFPRCLIDSHVWLKSSPAQKTIFVTLLTMVNHSEKEWEYKGRTVVCKPGQTVTSLETIQEKCGKGISIQNVRTAIRRFGKLGILTNESSNEGRLITISSWEDYQFCGLPEKSNSNKRSTTGEQPPNKYPTPNKNEKNDEINLKKMILKNKNL